jgi:hypothetical protein
MPHAEGNRPGRTGGMAVTEELGVEMIRKKAAISCKTVLMFVCAVSSAAPVLPAREVAVVVPPASDDVERFAGEQIQHYLERITRQPVALTAKRVDAAECVFLRFASESEARTLGKEGYRLRSVDGGLEIVGGGSRGALYGAYDLLERLGCRWYYMGTEDEIVPALTTDEVIRVLRSGLQVEEKPDFPVRMRRLLVYDMGLDREAGGQAVRSFFSRTVDWSAKIRLNILQFAVDHTPECMNYWPAYRAAFPEMRRRDISIGMGGHCMFLFLPPQEFKDHPEWFALVDGKRQSVGQFCLRNEEALRFCIDNMVRFLRDNPEVEYFAPWPNDNGLWCECDRCRGTPLPDLFMEAGNRIYRALKAAAPHVRFTHFAYESHLAVPATERPAPGLTVTICTHSRDLSVPFFDLRTLAEHREAFEGWREICREAQAPLVFHGKYARHWGLFGFHPLPLPILGKDCRWFARQGLAGFELPQSGLGWRTKSLNLYVLARLMWHADADVDAILRDYFDRFYGPAAGPMRAAYEEVEQAQPDLRYWKHNIAKNLASHPVSAPYPQEVSDYAAHAVENLALARRRVEQAQRLADNRALSGRIDRFARSLAYVDLEWRVVHHLTEGSRQFAQAQMTGEAATRIGGLREAQSQFEEAKRLSDRRDELAAEPAAWEFYWDVNGRGPTCLFKASQVRDWLEKVRESRNAVLASQPAR